MDRFSLEGRTALVTGASRGIGAGIAAALDEAGARVALLARDRARLEEVAKGLAHEPVIVTADLAEPAAPTAAAGATLDALGRTSTAARYDGEARVTGNRRDALVVKDSMRTRPPLTGLLLLVLLLGAACGDPATTARADQRAGEPWGRDFLSVAVTEGGRDRPLVNGTRIRLGFHDDGRLSAGAGCNSMGGQAEIRDGRLVVADLATTEMGCDPDRHAQDTWLAEFLTSRPRFDLTGEDLTLTGESAEIRLQDREVADPDRPLQGTRWVVDTIVQGDAAGSVPQGAEAHITLRDDGTFGGSTGCNQMGGNAVVDDSAGTITWSDVIATKMACDDDKMALERAVLSVLDGEVAYGIKADRLTLTHPENKGLGLRAQ